MLSIYNRWYVFLQNMTEDPDEEKQKNIQKIRNLYAFNLFAQHRFDDSLKIFAELGTGKYFISLSQ